MSNIEKILQSNELYQSEKNYLKEMEEIAFSGKNKTAFERIGKKYNLDQTTVKELNELYIVCKAKDIAQSNQSEAEKWHDIKQLYKNQANISHRTSMSILLQQYSTPAPIAYLMGQYTNQSTNQLVYEPSAGNGMLLVNSLGQIYVNEIDKLRSRYLAAQGYLDFQYTKAAPTLTRNDASLLDYSRLKLYDVILTNPPFGKLDKKEYFKNIKVLDHKMALFALEYMKDSGKAAIIVGGHGEYDEQKRIKSGKNRLFYWELYQNYNVDDIIHIDGSLYSKQGTTMDVRLILINGRKTDKTEVFPTEYSEELHTPIKDFDVLKDRVLSHKQNKDSNYMKAKAKAKAYRLKLQMIEQLGAPYEPISITCADNSLQVSVPDNMAYDTHAFLKKLKNAVGGDVVEWVRQKLQYKTKDELCSALADEQIDGVAMAIYNIETKKQGIIIGDQTGIGKGRQAAALIRYGVIQGKKPIFMSQKSNLFTDMYRDLSDIGSGNLVPFIVNSAADGNTKIIDKNGKVIFKPLPQKEQEQAIKNQKLSGYDFIMATYSQFAVKEDSDKKKLIAAFADDNIFILDESHEVSGKGITFQFMFPLLKKSAGVCYLSATFAKTPENLPIYSAKTAIGDVNMDSDSLVEAITRGGVPLQEIISAQLVSEGQMLRRERAYDGIAVNYITLDKDGANIYGVSDKQDEHEYMSDTITFIMREIVRFQKEYITPAIYDIDSELSKSMREAGLRKGTGGAGVDNTPYFSKMFNAVAQLLISIKAKDVAELTIKRLKEGFKPVIALRGTMETFINANADIEVGEHIRADFTTVLKRGLDGVMRYTIKNPDGSKEYYKFNPSDLGIEAQTEYNRILKLIDDMFVEVPISPIDYIIALIEDAGYTVAEITGRQRKIRYDSLKTKGGLTGTVMNNPKRKKNEEFAKFQNNELDVLIINTAGATGASVQAIPTKKVPASEVKPRTMIIAEAELNISTEVQKRGRINRTGQIIKPQYDYLISAIPAEKRFFMMLAKKLKSLDANTSSNQKQSESILKVDDFLNKYGDKVVRDYCEANKDFSLSIDDPLNLFNKNKDEVKEEMATKVAARVAILPTREQKKFYDDIIELYADYIEQLKQTDEYDLEVDTLNIEATLENREIAIVGTGNRSVFSQDSYKETLLGNNLRKPMKKAELDDRISKIINGQDPRIVQSELIQEITQYYQARINQQMEAAQTWLNIKLDAVKDHHKVKKAIKDKLPEEEIAVIKKLLVEKIQEEYEEKKASVQALSNVKSRVLNVVRFFYSGRGFNYNHQGNDYPAVFIGFNIDRKKDNPFAPSAMTAIMAISGSLRLLNFKLSGEQGDKVFSIIGQNSGVNREDYLPNWDNLNAKAQADKIKYKIITGNILQAAAKYKGKLINFTMEDGSQRRGILLNDDKDVNKVDKITVPIYRGRNAIKSMTIGSMMYCNRTIFFVRKSDRVWEMALSASQQNYGDIFLNEDVLKNVDNNNFDKVGDKMRAVVYDDQIDGLTNVLESNFQISIELAPNIFDAMKEQFDIQEPTLDIDDVIQSLPQQEQTPIPSQDDEDRERQKIKAKAKALALKLKIELLNL